MPRVASDWISPDRGRQIFADANVSDQPIDARSLGHSPASSSRSSRAATSTCGAPRCARCCDPSQAQGRQRRRRPTRTLRGSRGVTERRQGASGADGWPPRREPPVLGWRGRLEALQRSVMRTRLVRAVLDVMRAYDRGGGGMLAGALAYFAFFTLVPALLLFVGLLGVLVEDSGLRQQLIDGAGQPARPHPDVAQFVVIDGWPTAAASARSSASSACSGAPAASTARSRARCSGCSPDPVGATSSRRASVASSPSSSSLGPCC